MSALWTADALAIATGGSLAGPGFAASGVAIDSRRLRAGDLFVALHGPNSDGHAHVGEALSRGAAGAMVDRVPEGVARDAPLLVVRDTRAGLTDIGAAGRARFAGPVIAVTGSVGKTTTKDMLCVCLTGDAGAPHAAEASHNNHWGVPLTLARLPPDARACIVEIGMNHAGEIAPLSRLARPDVAVITAIGTAHVGHLGSVDAIADEKAAIAAGLMGGGTAVLPADTPLLDRLRAGMGVSHRVLTFGASALADTLLRAVDAGPDHCGIEVVIGGERIGFRLHAPGRHMALNALAALTAVWSAGFDVRLAAQRLEQFTAGAGRGAKQTIAVHGGTAVLIDESYNASPASVRAALAVLGVQRAKRRIAVLGDMRELGAQSRAEHRGLADTVTADADVLFTCGIDMRALYDAVPASCQGAHAATAEALAIEVASALRDGDAVLVKGSNGSRMRVVVAALQAGQDVLDQAAPRAGAA